MATRAQIQEEARSFIGTPYVHQGRVKGVGVDCFGLVMCVGINVGVLDASLLKIPELNNYGKLTDRARLVKYLNDHLTRIQIKDAQIGDVLIFAFKPMQEQHMGIRTDIGVIHGADQRFKVLEHRIDKEWEGYLARVYQFPNVTE